MDVVLPTLVHFVPMIHFERIAASTAMPQPAAAGSSSDVAVGIIQRIGKDLLCPQRDSGHGKARQGEQDFFHNFLLCLKQGVKMAWAKSPKDGKSRNLKRKRRKRRLGVRQQR